MRKRFTIRSHDDARHPLARKIVALLPNHKTLTRGQLVLLIAGKHSTLKLRIREHVEKGHLIPKGEGRGHVARPSGGFQPPNQITLMGMADANRRHVHSSICSSSNFRIFLAESGMTVPGPKMAAAPF